MADEPEDAPVARGKPIERTDAELAEAARIGEADIESGVEFWHEHAPEPRREMIDAVKERQPRKR